MAGRGFTPNNNTFVIRMLSREFGKCNRGRNRILLGAVTLCIVTLTMVFGISYGKVQAEYIRAVRAAGTTAATYMEDADASQYAVVNSLGYVKHAGKRVEVGEASASGKRVCGIQWLDENAWETMAKPAYTGIVGEYPEEAQDILLSRRALQALQIDSPEKGMEIPLEVSVGIFRTEQETFRLCGWYTDYVDETAHKTAGYVSEAKLKAWGLSPDREFDILICQADHMDWKQTEEKLYCDVPMNSPGQKVAASDTYAYDAVNKLAGSYGMAALGAVVILSGMFFLLYNVMQISMAGDVRQLGLLNTIGTTKKQIRGIWYGQIRRILIPGVAAGALLSAGLLLAVIPRILGKQYLRGYGEIRGPQIFRPVILAAAVLSVVLLTMGVAAGVLRRVVRVSGVESAHYTGVKERKQKTGRKRPGRKKRSAKGELWYMAWQNLMRYRGRFLVTVLSLFLGLEAFLGVVVVNAGSDYVHVIENRPDFMVAGQFSEWGQELGYGNEYRTRDAGEDPLKTEGDIFALLYGNDYEEFSPISSELQNRLLDIDGVDRERSYVMEGAYMNSVLSQKGIRPFVETEGDAGMVEGFTADVVQILREDELEALKDYVERQGLSVDMKSLEDGSGVLILHDHKLSPAQETQAEEGVGEPLYFSSLRSKAEQEVWNQMTAEQRETAISRGEFAEKRSELLKLGGYLDTQAEGFPNIRQTWHGAEGSFYYLISEKGFEKLPTGKKTLYMELEAEEEKEPQVGREIQKLVSHENMLREQMSGIQEGNPGEAGVFYISKSDLLKEAADYIRGNRLILGSISAVLLFAGLTNYFNVVLTGIWSRKKELEVMESIGMTKRQKRTMLMAEGGYYCLFVGMLMLSVGSGMLKGIAGYMESRLSYFVFTYPAVWVPVLLGGLAFICLSVPWIKTRRPRYSPPL